VNPKHVPRIIGVVYLATGIVKLYAIALGYPITRAHDPIFLYPYRWLLSIAALVEIPLGLALCAKPMSRWVNIALLIFSTNLLIYRFAWFSLGQPDVCPCFGGVLGSSRVLNEIGSWMLFTVACISFILSGSFFYLKHPRAPVMDVSVSSLRT
jgi:hypothetical protein